MIEFLFGAAVGIVAGAFLGDAFGAKVRAVVTMWLDKARNP